MRQPASSKSTQHEPPESSNPLLAGIFLASNEAELLPLLARNPFWDYKWLADNQDIDLFRAYLSCVVVPTNSVIEIGLNIHRAFKASAYQLNPAVQNNRIDYFLPSHSTAAFSMTQTTHCGVVILGITGLGKTYALVAALNTIPQTIKRPGLPGMSAVTQITWIRIDMSGIASIEALAEQITIVSAVIGMGKSLKQRVIAEGVETSVQLAFLKAQRCDEGQGFELSYPLPAEDFACLLAGRNESQPWCRPAGWEQGPGAPAPADDTGSRIGVRVPTAGADCGSSGADRRNS